MENPTLKSIEDLEYEYCKLYDWILYKLKNPSMKGKYSKIARLAKCSKQYISSIKRRDDLNQKRYDIPVKVIVDIATAILKVVEKMD